MSKCKVEVFSRVTGFFRPVQNWNEGKQKEFEDRKTYKIESQQHKGDSNAETSEG